MVKGFSQGKQILAQALARKDGVEVNGVYDEPTHNLESGRVDSAGVEGSSSAELQGGEVQTLMDKFRANAGDQYRGIEQSYNPAPPSTLQLTDQPHNAAADAAAGVGLAAAAAAAAPDSAQKQYQPLKEVCHFATNV